MNLRIIGLASIFFVAGYAIFRTFKSGIGFAFDAETYHRVWAASGVMLLISLLTDLSPETGAAFGALIATGFVLHDSGALGRGFVFFGPGPAAQAAPTNGGQKAPAAVPQPSAPGISRTDVRRFFPPGVGQ